AVDVHDARFVLRALPTTALLFTASLIGQTFPADQFAIGASAKAIFNGPEAMLIGPNYAHALTTHDRGKKGLDASYAHNFTARLGVQLDLSAYFSNKPESGKFDGISQEVRSDVKALNAEVGPQFRLVAHGRITVYCHALTGFARVHGSFQTSGPYV